MAAATQAALVKFLAVGKLVKDASGEFAAGKHLVLCSHLQEASDPAAKSYKTRVGDIMTKAASKLQMGKRICLTSDDPGTDYELQLMAEEVEESPGVIIIFFVATDAGFGKAQSITKLFADFKSGFIRSGRRFVHRSGGRRWHAIAYGANVIDTRF